MNPQTPRPMPLRILTLLALVGVTGCASTAQPVVYPSAKGLQGQRAEADRQVCQAEAKAVVGMNAAVQPATGARVAQRGAVEFADKAVESLVSGSKEAWAKARGAGAGVMAGSITAIALNWNEPDGVYRSYVDLCLKARGHTVLGWR